MYVGSRSIPSFPERIICTRTAGLSEITDPSMFIYVCVLEELEEEYSGRLLRTKSE
jgi:hypothetical protein